MGSLRFYEKFFISRSKKLKLLLISLIVVFAAPSFAHEGPLFSLEHLDLVVMLALIPVGLFATMLGMKVEPLKKWALSKKSAQRSEIN
jgi:hypothetical protein